MTDTRESPAPEGANELRTDLHALGQIAASAIPDDDPEKADHERIVNRALDRLATLTPAVESGTQQDAPFVDYWGVVPNNPGPAESGRSEALEAVVRFAEDWAAKWERIAEATGMEGEFNRSRADALRFCAFAVRENVQTLREEAAPMNQPTAPAPTLREMEARFRAEAIQVRAEDPNDPEQDAIGQTLEYCADILRDSHQPNAASRERNPYTPIETWLRGIADRLDEMAEAGVTDHPPDLMAWAGHARYYANRLAALALVPVAPRREPEDTVLVPAFLVGKAQALEAMAQMTELEYLLREAPFGDKASAIINLAATLGYHLRPVPRCKEVVFGNRCTLPRGHAEDHFMRAALVAPETREPDPDTVLVPACLTNNGQFGCERNAGHEGECGAFIGSKDEVRWPAPTVPPSPDRSTDMEQSAEDECCPWPGTNRCCSEDIDPTPEERRAFANAMRSKIRPVATSRRGTTCHACFPMECGERHSVASMVEPRHLDVVGYLDSRIALAEEGDLDSCRIALDNLRDVRAALTRAAERERRVAHELWHIAHGKGRTTVDPMPSFDEAFARALAAASPVATEGT